MVRRSKYNSKKTSIDGIVFHSKREAGRYQELKLLKKNGKISGFAMQVPFPVFVKGKKVFTYYADFAYIDENFNSVVEDVKGMRLPVYRLKKKIVEATYGIRITEV